MAAFSAGSVIVALRLRYRDGPNREQACPEPFPLLGIPITVSRFDPVRESPSRLGREVKRDMGRLAKESDNSLLALVNYCSALEPRIVFKHQNVPVSTAQLPCLTRGQNKSRRGGGRGVVPPPARAR